VVCGVWCVVERISNIHHAGPQVYLCIGRLRITRAPKTRTTTVLLARHTQNGTHAPATHLIAKKQSYPEMPSSCSGWLTFSSEFIYLLFFVCFLAELLGLHVLSSTATQECCQPHNTTEVNLPNGMGNFSGNTSTPSFCFVDDLFDAQREYLIGTVILILVSYAVACSILQRERVLKTHPECCQSMWQGMRMLAHTPVFHTVNFCIVWLAGSSLGFSMSLAEFPCITSGDVWNTYVQYLGLGVFTLLWGIATGVFMQRRIQLIITANQSRPILTHNIADARPVQGSRNRKKTSRALKQPILENESLEEEEDVDKSFQQISAGRLQTQRPLAGQSGGMGDSVWADS
jgi:hypothetical protein